MRFGSGSGCRGGACRWDALLDPSSITVTGHLESSGPTTVELAIRHIQKQIDQQHSDDAARSPLEPFWNSLKYEVVYHQRFATFAEARCAIFNYIETFYNRTRLHSSLAYRSPITFESQLNQQN